VHSRVQRSRAIYNTLIVQSNSNTTEASAIVCHLQFTDSEVRLNLEMELTATLVVVLSCLKSTAAACEMIFDDIREAACARKGEERTGEERTGQEMRRRGISVMRCTWRQ
jgi:hypothetical protein